MKYFSYLCTMKERLIEFSTAKLAKEKGYPTNPHYGFRIDGSWVINQKRKQLKLISQPTQSLLEDWLFEEHEIHIEITFDDGEWLIYVGEFSFPDSSVEFVGSVECEGFKDSKLQKRKAKELALQKALNLIK